MEEYIRNGVKKIGLWALVVVTVVAVIIIRAQRPNSAEDGLNVFEHIYSVGQILTGDAEDAAVMVRLEADKTMLLRDKNGIWRNLGIVYRGGTETGAVEVWNTEDGSYRILVMRDGVQLAAQTWTAQLSRVDTLDVGVNTNSGSQFLTPQWYPEGETVKQELLVRCTVSEKVTLVLNLEEYQEELTLLQNGEAVTLPRDRSRTFLLEVEAAAGESFVFEVPYAEGAYRFALVFE